ncbi:MAG: UDP-N-acetylmuramate--L-alanine ligase, partial [Rhodospirillales bacterium]|nr:UDP-N-acetylmuramate--L-alanine ligase [Rhodospirillales bacterium]
YAAGEQPIDGVNRDSLVRGLQQRGHRRVLPLPAPEALAGMVYELAKPGDLVVCLGAGNITTWAHSLPGDLDAIAARRSAGL